MPGERKPSFCGGHKSAVNGGGMHETQVEAPGIRDEQSRGTAQASHRSLPGHPRARGVFLLGGMLTSQPIAMAEPALPMAVIMIVQFPRMSIRENCRRVC